ncbi:MAG: nucleotidyltransferase family protein, partial [Armatimonadetes bacterium]|nr:nucleotidyltransferase family protein [Armatimonadota bacterium]
MTRTERKGVGRRTSYRGAGQEGGRSGFDSELIFLRETLSGFAARGSACSPPRVPEGVDWEYVLARSAEHRIRPILRSVLRAGETSVPEDVRRELESAYFDTLGTNLAALSWTEALLQNFENLGIPAVPIKGISHCRTLYEDPGLRPFCDIDLLVPRDSAPGAARALEQSGMRIEPGNSLDELLRIYNHATYVKADGGGDGIPLNVELHWGFHESSTPAHFHMESVWRDAVPSGNHRSLCLEDELIFGAHHLCEHLFFNASPALIWILDLALRLRISADSIDWEAFTTKNEAYGTSASSAVALMILEHLFSGP